MKNRKRAGIKAKQFVKKIRQEIQGKGKRSIKYKGKVSKEDIAEIIKQMD